MKESAFAYISDTEDMSRSGWEVFQDCGTVAFRDENGHPLMKKSKDTTKVVRTYRLKRILQVDRQPGITDNEDEEDSSDMDCDPDFLSRLMKRRKMGVRIGKQTTKLQLLYHGHR